MCLSLVLGQAERLRPPRAVHCEFPLGRPLGKPNDAAFQRRVLEAAFALLERPSGPVLEIYDEEIADSADDPLACPMPPAMDQNAHPAVAEARGLRPAYERARALSGRSVVGQVVDADGVPDVIEAFARIAEGTPWKDAGVPGNIVQAAMDVRAYYEEAALALSDHTPAARAAESWFYRSTHAGRTTREAQQQLQAQGAPVPVWFYLTPATQQG